jgi:hypothetical protein
MWNVLPQLGRLQRRDPRNVWKHEALDFTRWLLENIEILGETLGLEIEVHAEVGVGAFAVDLAGTDVGSGRPVIVENQLAATDHAHLGQLLTYAAGLDATIVVWISPHFRDEHRQALDWLNSHTGEGIDFFGVELEVLQIEGSLLAPNLKLVAQPNEWAKGTKAAAAAQAQPGKRALAYKAFFESALGRLKQLRPGVTTASRVQPQNWFTFGAGRSYVAFSWSFPATGELRAELYVDAPTQDLAKAMFDALKSQSASIEAAIGQPISWERLDERRASRLAVYHSVAGDVDPVAQPELVEWAASTMAILNDVLRPLVKAL